MTTAEAAKSLGLHRSRVIALIHAGKLDATKRGRDWWIEQTALDALVIETKYRTKERRDTR